MKNGSKVMSFTVLNPKKREIVHQETPAEKAQRETAESAKRFLDRHFFVRGEPRSAKAVVRSRHDEEYEVYYRVSPARGARVRGKIHVRARMYGRLGY